MFLFLSKFLPHFVYPLGFSCILIIAAILIVRNPYWQRLLLMIALGLLWISSTRWVAMGLVRSLEWQYLPPDEIPNTEVVVLLGGGTEPVEEPRTIVEINSAGDRIIYTAWLYNQNKVEKILISGGLLDWTISGGTPAGDMAVILEMLDVPKEVLIIEDQSRNTYENALYSAEILQQLGVDKILLVTSASHMPRSVRLFEAQGLQVTALPTDFTVTEKSWQDLTQLDIRVQILNLLPNAGFLSETTRALKEYLGIMIYSLRGWL